MLCCCCCCCCFHNSILLQFCFWGAVRCGEFLNGFRHDRLKYMKDQTHTFKLCSIYIALAYKSLHFDFDPCNFFCAITMILTVFHIHSLLVRVWVCICRGHKFVCLQHTVVNINDKSLESNQKCLYLNYILHTRYTQ